MEEFSSAAAFAICIHRQASAKFVKNKRRSSLNTFERFVLMALNDSF